MSTIELSFGQIDAVCAAYSRIASDKRVAFMGRLKQLQKHDIIKPDRRPGRGKPGSYSFPDLMRFVIAVELMQSGLMPKMAADLVNGSWSLLRYSVYCSTLTEEQMEEWEEMPLGPGPEARDWFWMLAPAALADMTEEGLGIYDHMEAIDAVPFEEVAERLQNDAVFGNERRTIVLHGTKITGSIVGLVEYQFGYATREQMQADLTAEFNRLNDVLRDTPFQGVEEQAQMRFETVKAQTIEAWASDARRARYFPAPARLAKQAKAVVVRLQQDNALYQLAYLRSGDFGGEEIADIEATTLLMGRGLVVPTFEHDETMGFKLTPLGEKVVEEGKSVSVPADAIEQYRKSKRRDINAMVQRKIDALLMSDPDNPEDDEALQRWARYGGKAPYSEKRAKENARRFVQGMREELKDDPEAWDDFKSRLGRMAEREHNGDDQEA